MTASVPSGTDQSSRSRPPEAVSPDTPALIISTFIPLVSKAFCNFAGNAALAGRPSPALKESPSTTILTGLAAPADGPCALAVAAVIKATINTSMCTNVAIRPSTRAAEVPYDRAMDSLIEPSSLSGVAPDTISISNVNLSLGSGAARVHILKDISLRVASGEAIGLIGPSGSGKSTLLMVMAGLERPDSGEVVVNGTPFNTLDEDALARFRGRQVGIVFQSFHLIPTMTALENVAVPLELAGNPDAAERAAAELTSVGLGHRLHHYPTQLSGGEQQRVALARALAPDPAILVADEPTGNLDEATGKQIVDLLFTKHAERGMTLVLVTHDSSLAQRCDRVVRLRSGRIDGQSAT
jgi:putative ABC transport system ATP-binding protein